MNDEQKRAWVGALYPGPKWKKRVSKMPDAQIFAIWTRAHNQPPKPKQPKPDVQPKENPDDIPF